MNKSILAATLLILLGCLQMIGDLTGSSVIKAIGAASHASPAPKVFTTHKGFETFSSQFFIEWDNSTGRQQVQITPNNYNKLKGPYNRRNAYGAALSYGPILSSNPHTQNMLHSVSQYALCQQAPVLKELGIKPDSTNSILNVRLQPRDPASANGQWTLSYQVDCTQEVT